MCVPVLSTELCLTNINQTAIDKSMCMVSVGNLRGRDFIAR
jgi:hypothetical protein